ncbi:cysteine--tRNA ligase [Candidatus Daviesbacteria bacterium]|nr:cysteine--tRNA ligase [Candidatus Daviesbacteria bacterium]
MKIYNSLSRRLEEFKPLHKNKVTIYVCGITPYDTTHLGHAFTYIFFDVLIRYLKFKGFNVIYTQNVTDINDRDKDILQRAKEQNTPWQDLADFWTKRFLQDMQVLNWTPPDHYLKASEQLVSIIRIINTLLQNGYAYKTGPSVYLDISRFPEYGKLSKFTKKQMIKKAEEFDEDLRNPDKKNPLDITLWRGSLASHSSSGNASGNVVPDHIPSFDSPFGPGRPGWHIECSAMSMSTLGQQIDIHGGGRDLIFPHHEAEIAQSEGATGKAPFAKYWIHTGQAFYRGQRMSKSKDNLIMVSDLLKKYSPNAIRWLLLSRHWSKDWEYKEKDLQKAQRNMKIIESDSGVGRSLDLPRMTKIQTREYNEFIQILDNNLDTPKALEFLLRLTKKSPELFKSFYEILGFTL